MSDTEYTQEEPEFSSKEAYRRVQSIIEHNTGGEQPPLVPKTPVFQVVGHTSLSNEQASRALRAMKQNDDLFEWDDRVCLKTDESLLAVIEAECEREPTRKALIAKANEARREVRQ